MKISFFFIFLLLLTTACSHNKNIREKSTIKKTGNPKDEIVDSQNQKKLRLNNNVDPDKIKNKKGEIIDSLDHRKLLLNNNTRIIVLTKNKVYDRSSSSADSDAQTMITFNKWKLDSQEVVTIIKSSKPINGTELDFNYLVFPYWYEGKIKINNMTCNYLINAASFLYLDFKDTSLILGCDAKNCRDYFIEHPAPN